jgi:hypothetical protein
MKYLIISNFSQNVSRMNTGDLTKLWRLKNTNFWYHQRSKHYPYPNRLGFLVVVVVGNNNKSQKTMFIIGFVIEVIEI